MNDRRVTAIRNALEAFSESVDAMARIARWGDLSYPVPDSLQQAAAHLEANMKTANSLAGATFSGAPAIVHRLMVSSNAVKRLSSAYEEYLKLKAEPNSDALALLEGVDAAIDSVNEDLRKLDD